MTLTQLRIIAHRKGIVWDDLEKTGLIWSIQKAEGYCECYATEWAGECGQKHCPWRKDCFKAEAF